MKSHTSEAIVISPLFAKPIINHARKIGLGLERHFQEKGFEDYLQLVFAPHCKTVPAFPVRSIMGLAEENNIAEFGFHTAIESGKPLLAEALDDLFCGSRSLYEFITRFCHFANQHLSLFNYFDLESDSDGLFIRRNHHYQTTLANDAMDTYVLTLFIELIGHYLQKNWRPKLIWLASKSKPEPEFAKYLGDQHVFSGRAVSKIFVQNDTLSQVSPLFRSKTNDAKHPSQTMRSQTFGSSAIHFQAISDNQPDNTREVIELALTPYALDKLPTLETLSNLLGIHPKQIQLKLAKEHTHYRDLILAIKAKRAEELMLHTDFDMNRIAIEVGYQNSTHFARAMKKLWGMTPLKYSKQLTL